MAEELRPEEATFDNAPDVESTLAEQAAEARKIALNAKIEEPGYEAAQREAFRLTDEAAKEASREEDEQQAA